MTYTDLKFWKLFFHNIILFSLILFPFYLVNTTVIVQNENIQKV